MAFPTDAPDPRAAEDRPPPGYAALSALLNDEPSLPPQELAAVFFRALCAASPAALRWQDFAQSGRTLAHQAIEHGHHEPLFMILITGGDATRADFDGWGPIHLAAARDDEVSIRFLLAAGCDATASTTAAAVGHEGWSALHCLADQGRLRSRSARILRQHGARCDTEDADGRTPAMLQTLWDIGYPRHLRC